MSKYNVSGINISDNVDLKQYIKQKIKILERDFLITCTDKEIAHLNESDTVYAVDTACRKIIFDRFGSDG